MTNHCFSRLTEPPDAPSGPCADTWAHPAPPRVAAPRYTTLTPFPRRMCLRAGGKLPCTAKTCLASESKNAGTHEANTHTRTCPRHQLTAIASPSTTRGARECHYFACPGWVCFYRDKVPSVPLNDLLCVSSFCMMLRLCCHEQARCAVNQPTTVLLSI